MIRQLQEGYKAWDKRIWHTWIDCDLRQLTRESADMIKCKWETIVRHVYFIGEGANIRRKCKKQKPADGEFILVNNIDQSYSCLLLVMKNGALNQLEET